MNRNIYRLVRLHLGVLCPTLLLSSPALALQAYVEGDVGPAAEFNTNIFGNPDTAKDVWGEGVDGKLNLSVLDDKWGTLVNTKFANRWFQDDEDLNYFNQFFNIKSYYVSERVKFGLDGGYVMDNTLTTLFDSGLDFGFVFTRLPRTTRSLSPNALISVDEKTNLMIGYTFQDVEYDQKKNPGRVVDSRSHIGTLALTHQWSERFQLTFNGNYTEYDLSSPTTFQSISNQIANGIPFRLFQFADGSSLACLYCTQYSPASTSTIRSSSFMLGFTYSGFIWDDLTVGFNGGGQYNETYSPDITTAILGKDAFLRDIVLPSRQAESNSYSFAEILTGSVSKKMERGQVAFDFNRSISPNLQGSLITSDRYSFSGSYKWTPQFSGNLNVTFYEQTSSSTIGRNTFDRSHVSFSPGVAWRFDENWTLNATYTYRAIDYLNTRTSAESHGLFLDIRYLLDKFEL